MLTREELEHYLVGSALDIEEIAEGMYVVRSPVDRFPVVLHHTPPLLIVRLKILDLPQHGERLETLYRTLLELNATDVVHGAYGIEDGELILSDTLPLEHLDTSEVRAALESIQMAASSHLERIRTLIADPAEA
jgi:hypothetical protein